MTVIQVVPTDAGLLDLLCSQGTLAHFSFPHWVLQDGGLLSQFLQKGKGTADKSVCSVVPPFVLMMPEWDIACLFTLESYITLVIHVV